MTPSQLLTIAPAIADDPTVVRPWPWWFVWPILVVVLAACAVAAGNFAAWWGLLVSGRGFGI